MRKTLHRFIQHNPVMRKWYNFFRNARFRGSAAYWENRYQSSGNSGPGSYGFQAEYKAAFINEFVSRNDIRSVLEFGCGDGNQLTLFRFPKYTGLDVSSTAIDKCKLLFNGDPSKQFFVYTGNAGEVAYRAELVMSLDVIYHLVEDDVFEKYMYDVFAAAEKYVMIYAWDTAGPKTGHVRHRQFTAWIAEKIPGFKLSETKKNTTSEPVCDFFIYERKTSLA